MECQNEITTKPHWYVIQTKPRQESVAEDNLKRQSFEVYFPQITEPRRHRGKWKEVIQPLFPRYLFVRLDLSRDNTAPIRSTHGVTKLVRFGEIPRPVPDTFIRELQQSQDLETGLHQPHTLLFKKGDEVVVISGPMEGLKGLFQATTGHERVTILLEMLGRQNIVVLNQNNVLPCSA